MNNILWRTPEESINGISNFTLVDNGNETILQLNFNNKKIEISFHNTMCYKHTCLNFSIDYVKIPECYEALIEVKESNWLNQMKMNNEKDFSTWKLKHYAILNQNDGLFQFIAESFTIKESSYV